MNSRQNAKEREVRNFYKSFELWFRLDLLPILFPYLNTIFEGRLAFITKINVPFNIYKQKSQNKIFIIYFQKKVSLFI